MAGEVFGFFAHRLAEPFADERAVDVVVVGPAFVTSVIRRVDVDASDLPGVIRKERLERDQIIALYDKIAVARLTAREFRHILQQMKRNLVMMIHHGLFPNPVQRRHRRQSDAGPGDCIVGNSKLDGVNQLDYLEGKTEKSARDIIFFYYVGAGTDGRMACDTGEPALVCPGHE